MQLTHHEMAVADARGVATPGHVFARRSTTESWLVLAAPVDLGGAADWALVAESDYVAVPLHRYYVARTPAAVALFSAAVAALALSAAAVRRAAAPSRLHVVHGDIVEDTAEPDGTPRYAVYLGFALQLTP